VFRDRSSTNYKRTGFDQGKPVKKSVACDTLKADRILALCSSFWPALALCTFRQKDLKKVTRLWSLDRNGTPLAGLGVL
jgi:hypothetical protein